MELLRAIYIDRHGAVGLIQPLSFGSQHHREIALAAGYGVPQLVVFEVGDADAGYPALGVHRDLDEAVGIHIGFKLLALSDEVVFAGALIFNFDGIGGDGLLALGGLHLQHPAVGERYHYLCRRLGLFKEALLIVHKDHRADVAAEGEAAVRLIEDIARLVDDYRERRFAAGDCIPFCPLSAVFGDDLDTLHLHALRKFEVRVKTVVVAAVGADRFFLSREVLLREPAAFKEGYLVLLRLAALWLLGLCRAYRLYRGGCAGLGLVDQRRRGRKVRILRYRAGGVVDYQRKLGGEDDGRYRHSSRLIERLSLGIFDQQQILRIGGAPHDAGGVVFERYLPYGLSAGHRKSEDRVRLAVGRRRAGPHEVFVRPVKYKRFRLQRDVRVRGGTD